MGSNASFIYIGRGMFKQNIYGNEDKFETSAHPDIINTASFVQTVWFIQTYMATPSSSKRSVRKLCQFHWEWRAVANSRCADAVTPGEEACLGLSFMLGKMYTECRSFYCCLHCSDSFLISCLKHLIILLSCRSSNWSEPFKSDI